MKTDFTIREAQQTDTIALKELFQNTVLAVNSKDYSQAEVEDWMPNPQLLPANNPCYLPQEQCFEIILLAQ